jgi:hypothetical protein
MRHGLPEATRYPCYSLHFFVFAGKSITWSALPGTALSTLGLTIPAVLTFGLVTGKTVVLGLEVVEMIIPTTTLLRKCVSNTRVMDV